MPAIAAVLHSYKQPSGAITVTKLWQAVVLDWAFSVYELELSMSAAAALQDRAACPQASCICGCIPWAAELPTLASLTPEMALIQIHFHTSGV